MHTRFFRFCLLVAVAFLVSTSLLPEALASSAPPGAAQGNHYKGHLISRSKTANGCTKEVVSYPRNLTIDYTVCPHKTKQPTVTPTNIGTLRGGRYLDCGLYYGVYALISTDLGAGTIEFTRVYGSGEVDYDSRDLYCTVFYGCDLYAEAHGGSYRLVRVTLYWTTNAKILDAGCTEQE